METLGEKILKLRTQKRLSQEELGGRVGVSRQTISKWEADFTQPNLENIKSLCAILEVSIDYFFNIQSKTEIVAESIEVQPDTEVITESIEVQPDTEVITESIEVQPDTEVITESTEAQPEMEVVAENDGEQPVSESISIETDTETKRKPWKPLVVAIVFSVVTFVLLFFSIITGQTAFSPNQGVTVVSDHGFDRGNFFVGLGFTILSFIIAVADWIVYICIKKGKC